MLAWVDGEFLLNFLHVWQSFANRFFKWKASKSGWSSFFHVLRDIFCHSINFQTSSFFLSSSFYPSFLYDNNHVRCIYRITIEIHLAPSLSLISSEVYDLPVWCCTSIWLSACWKGVETIRKIRKVINTKRVTQKDFRLFKDSTLLHVGRAMRSIWSLLAGEDV